MLFQLTVVRVLYPIRLFVMSSLIVGVACLGRVAKADPFGDRDDFATGAAAWSTWCGCGIGDRFSSDPFGRWSIAIGPGDGFGDNSGLQFEHAEENGVLMVHYDSASPTVRLQRPLLQTLTDQDSFHLKARLWLDSIEAPFNDFMQISIALTNSVTTGANRTGLPPFFDDANTYDNIELAYYPNPGSDFGGGPWVTTTVEGSDVDGSPSWMNSSFNSVEMALPTGQWLDFHMKYLAKKRKLVFRVRDVASGTVLAMTKVDIDGNTFINPAGGFEVNTLSITSYFDGADFDPGTTSLVADVLIDKVVFRSILDCE